MTKHEYTPAPWSIDRYQIRNATGEAIASVPYAFGGDEGRANARLIAAAPELLEALEVLLEWAEIELDDVVVELKENGEPEPLLLSNARQAITKALKKGAAND